MPTTLEVRIDEPHAGQQEVIDGATRFNVLECGRRFGKTKLGILLATITAIEGGPVGWFAPTYKFLPEVWAEAERTLLPLSPRIRVQERRIEIPATGGVWEFWSLDEPNAGRGRKYKRVILDEAGIVRGLMAAWQEAIRPTLTDLAGDAWFLGTPKGANNDFHRLFAKGEQGADGWRSFRLPTTANPHIRPSEVEAARRDMPESAFRQEFLGIPADDGGNPFGLSAIRACEAPLSSAPPAAWGVDLAKSQDWTVAVALDADGVVCRLERWQSDWGATRRTLIGLLADDAPALVDSTGVGDPIVEDLIRERPAVEGFKFTAPSKQQIMEGLAAAVQRREIRFPAGWLTSEMESFEYEYRPGGGVRYSAPPGMHDDGVCALALAVDKWQRDARTRVGFNRNFYVLTANG